MWGTWFAIGLFAAAALAAVALIFRRTEAQDPEWKAAYDATLAEGQADPRKAWVAAIFTLVVGDADPALRPRFAASWLAEQGVADEAAFERAVAELASTEEVWPLARAIALIRAGAGRGWCTDAESWARVWPLARALQACCSDFEHLAQAYLRGLRAAGRPDAEAAHVAQTVVTLRAEVWPQVPYAQAL